MPSSDTAAASLLREARKRSGLSQVELARRAGVVQSVISAYESGSRQPSLPTLQRLITCAGFDLELGLRGSALSGPLGQRVREHRHEVKRVAAARGVSNLRVFGSVARGEESPDSDIDLLIDVAPGVGLLELARLADELEALLAASIDLVPAAALKPGVRGDVETDLVPL